MSEESSKPEDIERHYVFNYRTGMEPNDTRREEVPESELTHAHIEHLFLQLHQYYHAMPGIVQDKMIAHIAKELEHERQAPKQEKKTVLLSADDLRRMDLNGGGKA